MIADTWTVAWRELRGLLYVDASLVRGLRPLLFSLAVFGVFLPLQFGRSLIESPAAILPWIWVPFLMTTGVVADAFAGERERHTLETLLVSRLPDDAILAGKVIAAVAYGLGFATASALVGVIVVNAASWQGRVVFYPPALLAALVVFGTIGSVLVAGAGALVSLQASSVRQASQMVSVVVFAIIIVPVVLGQVLPEDWRREIVRVLDGADLLLIAVVLGAILCLVDGSLLLAARRRFRRSQLVLD